MKSKPCELWVGTTTKFFKWASFESIVECKRYIKSCINCYHEIRCLEG